MNFSLTQLTQLSTHPCVLADEHESSLEKAKEEHRQRLEDMKKDKESSGFVSSVASMVNFEKQNDVLKLTQTSAGVPIISKVFSRAWRR